MSNSGTHDHRTLIASVDLPAKCCVKHFFAICITARINEESFNDSRNSSRWRYETMSSSRPSPKMQFGVKYYGMPLLP
jgi:NADH:ubiquinone oxidoreductase subunit 3 (subunit A)